MFDIVCALPKRLMLAGMVTLPSAALAQPQILSGDIMSKSVDVTQPAASPAVLLKVGGEAAFIGFLYQGPSGESFNQFFTTPDLFPASVKLRGYLPYSPDGSRYETAFNLYTEPGTWTLSGAEICSSEGFNCSYYNTSQVKSLFSNVTFTVTNLNKPDIQAPMLQSGNIRTRTVSIAFGPTLQINVHAIDDVSGVAVAKVCATSRKAGLCTVNAFPWRRILKGEFVTTLILPDNTQDGTYTIQSVSLTDIAGNTSIIANPSQISAAFNGHVTFHVHN